MSSDNLPSYKDFIENPDDLPSVEDFKEEVLPSINDFYQKPLIEETQTIENSDGESFLQVTDVVRAPEWSELVRLVNDVRKDIPEIPEIKCYDEELAEISANIAQIQDNYVKSEKIDVLSVQNEEFEGKLTEIESKIPTVKYYDHDINSIYDKITSITEELKSLPEVKYYEEDLESLKSRIEQVSESIPTVPAWFSESEETPDFSWIAKSFSLIDDDIDKVECHINIIKEKIKFEVRELNEIVEKKDFELKVDLKNLSEHLTENFDKTNDSLKETKDKLLEEVKDVSRRIWEQHHVSKDDDKKLKKSILSEQNKLKQSLQEEIKNINEKSVKADESIIKFFTDLKETVESLPEVKYYDDDVIKINTDIVSIRKELKELSELASLIKTEQVELKESYLLNEPPEEKQTANGQVDPLTPVDQNFATLDDLSNHYRMFLSRIQTQLSTLGGGGEVRLEFLDDIDRDTALVNGKFLKYDSSIKKWVGATGGGGGGSYSGTEGQLLQHDGSDYVGVSSVGIATFINDHHQGYYRYSTHYYSSGIANTVQTLPADEFVLIQPSVRTNKVDYLPQKMLSVNSNNPWIGAGATIGTGQTEFSLAGLDEGSTVIVRIASQFNPDIDNTNVDFSLNFTTNPTTQSFGTTSFSIVREQGLICNEGADQNYLSETLINFYVGSSLSGLTTQTAGHFNLSVRASDEGDFEMLALTINVVA